MVGVGVLGKLRNEAGHCRGLQAWAVSGEGGIRLLGAGPSLHTLAAARARATLSARSTSSARHLSGVSGRSAGRQDRA